MEGVDVHHHHILVLDDDTDLCGIYRQILEEEGCQVTSGVSPDVAPVSVVTALAPDLLLLDLRFGHTASGVDLLTQLKADPATSPIPVLICSADTRLLEDLHERLVAWDCGILPKPFDLEALLTAVRNGITARQPVTTGACDEHSDPVLSCSLDQRPSPRARLEPGEAAERVATCGD